MKKRAPTPFIMKLNTLIHKPMPSVSVSAMRLYHMLCTIRYSAKDNKETSITFRSSDLRELIKDKLNKDPKDFKRLLAEIPKLANELVAAGYFTAYSRVNINKKVIDHTISFIPSMFSLPRERTMLSYTKLDLKTLINLKSRGSYILMQYVHSKSWIYRQGRSSAIRVGLGEFAELFGYKIANSPNKNATHGLKEVRMSTFKNYIKKLQKDVIQAGSSGFVIDYKVRHTWYHNNTFVAIHYNSNICKSVSYKPTAKIQGLYSYSAELMDVPGDGGKLSKELYAPVTYVKKAIKSNPTIKNIWTNNAPKAAVQVNAAMRTLGANFGFTEQQSLSFLLWTIETHGKLRKSCGWDSFFNSSTWSPNAVSNLATNVKSTTKYELIRQYSVNVADKSYAREAREMNRALLMMAV